MPPTGKNGKLWERDIVGKVDLEGIYLNDLLDEAEAACGRGVGKELAQAWLDGFGVGFAKVREEGHEVFVAHKEYDRSVQEVKRSANGELALISVRSLAVNARGAMGRLYDVERSEEIKKQEDEALKRAVLELIAGKSVNDALAAGWPEGARALVKSGRWEEVALGWPEGKSLAGDEAVGRGKGVVSDEFAEAFVKIDEMRKSLEAYLTGEQGEKAFETMVIGQFGEDVWRAYGKNKARDEGVALEA